MKKRQPRKQQQQPQREEVRQLVYLLIVQGHTATQFIIFVVAIRDGEEEEGDRPRPSPKRCLLPIKS